MVGVMKVIGLLAFIGALVMIVDANAVGPASVTSTQIFSNFLGGDPFTYVTTITGFTTELASLGPGDTLSSAVGNHGPPAGVTATSGTLPPGVYLTTVPANHATPGVYTRTSSILPTKTVTFINTIRSTITIFGPANTVTFSVSEVAVKPTLITGFCHWTQEGVEIPCTYTAGNLPMNAAPTGVPTANGTNVNGTGVLTSSARSFGFSGRVNPFKPFVSMVKRVIDSQAGYGGGPSLAAFNRMIDNRRGNGSGIVATSHASAAISSQNNPLKYLVDGIKAIIVPEAADLGEDFYSKTSVKDPALGNSVVA